MIAPSKYKNTAKSTTIFFSESDDFSLLFFRNDTAEKAYQKYILKKRHIQFYWAVNESAKIAFNMPHCALEISTDETAMVFFKEESMSLLFDIFPSGGVIALFINVGYFHKVFTEEKNIYFNFDSLQEAKPLLSKTQTKPDIKMILHQILNQKIDAHLQGLYIKAKIHEILSLYFSKGGKKTEETCPFVANEQTLKAIKKTKDLIIEHMASPPSLSELSKSTGLNLQKLKVGFKKYYGMPIYTFLLDYKMNLSKKMLFEKNYNIAEISEQLGYSKSSHFITAFKKKFGITPKKFMKN